MSSISARACCAMRSLRRSGYANANATERGSAPSSRISRPTSISPATPTSIRASPTRSTNGTGTLMPEASTLKGRIAPSVVITEGGEKIGIVAATTQLLEAISSPDRHGGQRLSDRTGRQRRSRRHGSAGFAAAAHHQRADRRGREQDHPAVAPAADRQRAAACHQAAAASTSFSPAGSNTRLADADDELVAFPGHDAVAEGPYPIVTQGAGRQDDADRQHRRRIHLPGPPGRRVRCQRRHHGRAA